MSMPSPPIAHATPARALALTLALTFALTTGGCGGGGQLSIRDAAGEGNVLIGDFTTAVYAYDDNNALHALLIEGPPDAPTQAVHVQLNWRPWAGKTPVDRRATNATVRYIVFTGSGAGVYSGAGFLFPDTAPGAGVFRGTLRASTLRLTDASEDFADRLGRAVASGSFSARRDDVAAKSHLNALHRQLASRLGYPTFVDAGSR